MLSRVAGTTSSETLAKVVSGHWTVENGAATSAAAQPDLIVASQTPGGRIMEADPAPAQSNLVRAGWLPALNDTGDEAPRTWKDEYV